jgi:LPS sulfotransferase NodH
LGHIKARRDLSTISGAMNIGVSQAIRVELPAVSYLVCASQRSGTTMLCRALADIGTAGRPEEYFLAVDEVAQPGWRCWEHGPYGMAYGARSREEYLEIVFRLGSTPNGIFGAKLMWNNVPWAVANFKEVPRFSGLDRAEVFHAAFPGLRIVNITRRDRLRQAVSWARMAQDGVWVVSDEEPPRPRGRAEYNAKLIGDLEALIIEGERGWRELYAELGVIPYEVVYEDLVSEEGFEQSVRGVLGHLGLPSAGFRVPRPRTKRQADELNDAWVARYHE